MAAERYQPDPIQSVEDFPQLLEYILREHQRIANALESKLDNAPEKPLYAAPTKPRDFMIVAADGTTWNPGSGKGYYAYYNGAWHFLG